MCFWATVLPQQREDLWAWEAICNVPVSHRDCVPLHNVLIVFLGTGGRVFLIHNFGCILIFPWDWVLCPKSVLNKACTHEDQWSETGACGPLQELDEHRAHTSIPSALRLLEGPCSPASWSNTAFWLQKRALVKEEHIDGGNKFLHLSGPSFLDSLSLSMEVILFCCWFGHINEYGGEGALTSVKCTSAPERGIFWWLCGFCLYWHVKSITSVLAIFHPEM